MNLETRDHVMSPNHGPWNTFSVVFAYDLLVVFRPIIHFKLGTDIWLDNSCWVIPLMSFPFILWIIPPPRQTPKFGSWGYKEFYFSVPFSLHYDRPTIKFCGNGTPSCCFPTYSIWL